ncbi:TPA: hypothetical protein ACXLW8_004422 [Yersinia enterocolitica]|nr:hypothetical protein [Yersinia enterocolitica]HED0388295.1 hypothetical protein [Yersinia enterocolitica]
MLSKEQINSAMLSSLEGFSFSVVDSLEFELSRKLTAREQQEVGVIVERAVSEGISLREQLAGLKALQPVAEMRTWPKNISGPNPDWFWFGKQDFPVGTQLFTAAKPAED